MENVKINRHDFENAKNEIKTFSENLPSNPSFDLVRNDELWGLLDHTVTGVELNDFIKKVQEHFKSVYDVLRNSVKEFGTIYKALDTLDKDYINGILISLEKAIEASDQAVKAQENIHDTIGALKKSVEALGELKTNIDKQRDTIHQLTSNQQGIIEKIKTLDKVVGEFDGFKEKMSRQLGLNKQENKKIKTAYCTAGFSITLTFVQLILLLLGVL